MVIGMWARFICMILLCVKSTFSATVPAVPAECQIQQTDIVFAVDSSFSVRAEDFKRQLAFLKALVDQFPIGPDQVQVGVLSFGSELRLDIKLNDFNNTWDLKNAVGEIQHLRSGTETGKALKYIHEFMYEPEFGGRRDAKKQLFLITDGLSSDTDATLLQASSARNKGIEIFSVGVGRSLEDFEIRGVASEPKEEHIFKVDTYDALDEVEKDIYKASCGRGNVPENKDNEGEQENTISSVLQGCVGREADIVFLLDSSSSIWQPDFQKQIDFIKQVTSHFEVGPDAVRVGVVAFSDAPITLVSLEDRQDHEHIVQVLSKAPYITGTTDTAMTLRHARSMLSLGLDPSYLAQPEQKLNLHRHYVAKLIILLTDGEIDNLDLTTKEAQLSQEEGMKIFVVGVGEKASPPMLANFASYPTDDFVYHVEQFQSLTKIQKLLAKKTCKVAFDGKLPIPDAVCPKLPSDVVFVYDTVSLSRLHHNFVIKVISDVTESKTLNSDKLRVGVIREAAPYAEASTALHDIELTNAWTQSDFKAELDPDARTSVIGMLLRKVRHKYFNPMIDYDTTNHKRVVIIFLDSVLDSPYLASTEAIRLKGYEVRVVVVTLGHHFSHREAVSLASSPSDKFIKNVKRTMGHKKRDSLSTDLVNLICE